MLNRVLADNCETYNAALQERRDAWKVCRKSITYRNQQDELTELRKDAAFQWIACDIQRDPLRRVDHAFKEFFRRCQAGERPGYPRFKSRGRYDSFAFGNNVVVRERSIKVPNIGDIRTRGGRSIEGRAKVCFIKRDGKRWTASVICDIGPAPEKLAVSRAIGIDVGLTALVTLSDGQVIENPRWTRKHEDRIAAANQALARKQRRSKNRIKARETLRRAHQGATCGRARRAAKSSVASTYRANSRTPCATRWIGKIPAPSVTKGDLTGELMAQNFILTPGDKLLKQHELQIAISDASDFKVVALKDDEGEINGRQLRFIVRSPGDGVEALVGQYIRRVGKHQGELRISYEPQPEQESLPLKTDDGQEPIGEFLKGEALEQHKAKAGAPIAPAATMGGTHQRKSRSAEVQ